MAINIFGRPQQTTIADTDKLAAGNGTSAFFNITWANFKKLFSALWFGGVKKIEATAIGINVTGSGEFSDVVTINNNTPELKFIESDVTGAGASYRFIQNSNDITFFGTDENGSNAKQLLKLRDGTFTELYHYDVLKLATTLSGIDVAGKVAATTYNASTMPTSSVGLSAGDFYRNVNNVEIV